VLPTSLKLVASSSLHDAVNEGLEQKWSPEQISARLDEEYPDEPEMRVSPETIYQTLYLQARGELRTELKLALRQGRARRVPRSRATVSRERFLTWSTSASVPPKLMIVRCPVSGKVI
jgi:transposase, IS30 family